MSFTFRQDNLSTIADLMYMYDFRYLITKDGTGRITRWEDLSNKQFHLVPYFGTTSVFTDPVDGSVLIDAAAPVLSGFKFQDINAVRATGALNVMHDGSPWMHFAVVKVVNTGSSECFLVNTGGAGTRGARFFIQSDNSLRYTIWDSTSQIVNGSAPAGSVTSDYRLVTLRYYGAGVGANDIKISYGASVANTSTAGVHETAGWSGGGIMMRINNAVGTKQYHMKLNGGYSLIGKSVSQIDSLFSAFIRTLKLDPEYASLVTP